MAWATVSVAATTIGADGVGDQLAEHDGRRRRRSSRRRWRSRARAASGSGSGPRGPPPSRRCGDNQSDRRHGGLMNAARASSRNTEGKHKHRVDDAHQHGADASRRNSRRRRRRDAEDDADQHRGEADAERDASGHQQARGEVAAELVGARARARRSKGGAKRLRMSMKVSVKGRSGGPRTQATVMTTTVAAPKTARRCLEKRRSAGPRQGVMGGLGFHPPCRRAAAEQARGHLGRALRVRPLPVRRAVMRPRAEAPSRLPQGMGRGPRRLERPASPR